MLVRRPRDPGKGEESWHDPNFSVGCLVGIGGGLAMWAVILTLFYLRFFAG